MTANTAQLISTSIDQANSEFENTWSSVLEIARIAGSERDVGVASHRLLSYNPQNHVANEENKNLYSAVEVICNITAKKLEQVKKNPDDVETWALLAKCYLMLSDFPNAYTCCVRVVNFTPTLVDGAFWFVAGIVYQHFNYNKVAQSFYTLSLKYDSKASYIGDLNFRLAILYRSLNNLEEALPLFMKAKASIPPSLTEDDIKFQIAFTHQLMGSVERAAQGYTELLQRHPTSLELIQQYAWFLSLSKDNNALANAEQLASSALEQFPNDPILKFVLARIALQQQNTSIAYARYKDSLKTWSDSPLFWCGLGVLYFKNDQDQDAIVAFQRAIFLKYDIPEAWLNFGLIFQKNKKYEQALKIYTTAISNCRGNKLIQERINTLKSYLSTPGKVIPNYDVCEINGDKLFTQVAEKASLAYCDDLPQLTKASFNLPKDEEQYLDFALSALYSPHVSIFA